MAGAVGLRDVRYEAIDTHFKAKRQLWQGEPAMDLPKDDSNPYFTYDPAEMYRLLALCAGLRRGAGHLCTDDFEGRGFDSRVSVRHGGRPTFRCPRIAFPAVPAWQACPTATLQEKSIINDRHALEHSVITTCAYCGVGCQLQGRNARRRIGADDALQTRKG